MLRTLLIFLLSLAIALGSMVVMYKPEVDTMIEIGQEKLDELLNGEKPGPNGPTDDDDLKVESIAVDITGAQLVFDFASEFTAEGLKVIATMSDGSTKEIPLEDCRINPADTTKPGTRQVTVIYDGKSARYEVTVKTKVIPEISATPLLNITESNKSYRVEAEAFDMTTPGAKLESGFESFVKDADAGAGATSGNKYLTGYGVAWNYFGFTFTVAEEYKDSTLVIRVANSTASDINAGVVKMYLNFSQDENGVASGEIPLEGYIIEAKGACEWSEIIIRNLTIPAGTNTLTFEAQKNKSFDIDYIDFYVSMPYVRSLVELSGATTIVKDIETLDTEKAFTRKDVADAHGLKPGQLFVETVTKPIEGQVTSGGTSVGAIGKGSKISTYLYLPEDATVRIKFKASSVNQGDYFVADNWNFYIDDVMLITVERVNIKGGDSSKGLWWDWKYTNVGDINLAEGYHFFTFEVHGTDCNVDTIEFEILSSGSFADGGVGLDEMHNCSAPCSECGKCTNKDCNSPVCSDKCAGHENIDPNFDITVSADSQYKAEAEDMDHTNLKPSSGWEDKGVQIENVGQANPPTSGGKSLGACGGGYTTITIKLLEKATIQIYGRIAHANGGAASKFMSMSLGDTALEGLEDLPKGNANSQYWNWADVPFGAPLNLEAGEYTLTITFKSNPNFDCVKVDVLSYGSFTDAPVVPECKALCDKCGKCTDTACTQHTDKCQGHQTVVTPDITITDDKDSYKVEAEELDMSTLVPQAGFTSPKVEDFDGGKGLGGIGGGYQSFVVTTNKDVAVKLCISFANANGGSILSFIPAITVNGEAIELFDNQVPAGVGSPQESVSKFYWNVTNVHIATLELKAGETYTFKISVNQGNLDGYALEVFNPHVHTEEILDAVAPTCTATGLTEGKKCSSCGEILVAQEIVDALGHDKENHDAKAPNCTEIGWDAYETCKRDGCTYTTYSEKTALGHTEATRQENVNSAGCGQGGSYDLVTYCSVCNTVLSTENKIIEATGAHTPGEPIKENEVAPKCEEAGSYDLVTKCVSCGTETSRETKTVDATGHTDVIDEAKAPTCTETGLTEGKHCSVCNAVLVAQNPVDALGHTPAAAVVENKNDATCIEAGSYESVVYCSVESCKAQISRETKTIDAKGHTEETLAAVAPNSVKTGLTEGKKCSVCGVVTVEQQVVPALKLTINGAGEYAFEAENLDFSTLKPSSGWEDRGVQIETPTTPNPATSGGKSIGACGGGYTTFTFTLEQKATIQIYGRMAHANGGAASGYMVAMLDNGLLSLKGEVLKGDAATSQYWNWTDVPFGNAVDLEAGTYTITIRFKSNPNFDCVKLNVLSYGEFVTKTEGDLTIDGLGKYTFEAENVDYSSLVLRGDFIAANKFTFTEGWNNDFGSGVCLMGYTNGSVIRFYVDVKEAAKLNIVMRMSYASSATYDFSGTTFTFAGQTLTPVPAGEFGMRNGSDWWKWVDVALGEVEVEAGLHLFEIKVNAGDNHNIDRFVFTTVTDAALPCDLVCEHCGLCTNEACAQADHATKCDGHDVVIKGNESYTLEAENWSQDHMTLRSDLANHAAKNGNRLLENGGTTIGGMAAGSYIEFDVYAKADTTIAFIMKAAHSVECIVNKAMSITVDGVAVPLCNINIKGSGSAPWFDWTIFSMGYVNLTEGQHTIVLNFVQLSCNIDYLKLDVMSYGAFADSDVTLAKTGTTKYELEAMDCTQSLINTRSDFISNAGITPGYFASGSGRIYGYADGSIFRVVVTVEQACTLEIKLAGFGGTPLNQQLYFFGGQQIVPADGAVIGSGAVAEGTIGTVSVEAGTYVFEFTSGVNTDLDYVSFTVVE